MQVILLERVENLGQMGDTVTVKPGYARNFLLPRKKALRSTKDNIAFFETQKKQLEAENLKKKTEAEKVAKELDGNYFVLIRQASDTGQLYGSVSTRDIAKAVTENGFTINRNQVNLNHAFKQLGVYELQVSLHPEVKAEIKVNIAKSDEEAKVQEELFEKGELEPVSAQDAAEAVFEQEAEATAETAEEASETTETTEANEETSESATEAEAKE